MDKNHILSLLKKQRVAEAIAELRKCVDGGCYVIGDQLNEVEESYKFMVRYLAEGVKDPQRDKIYGDIIARLASLTETAFIECQVMTSSNLYFATIRMMRMNPLTLDELLNKCANAELQLSEFYELPESARDNVQEITLLQSREHAESDIFRYVWTAFPLKQDDANLLLQQLSAEDAITALNELIISALGLNLMGHYSELVLTLLLDIYLSNSISKTLTIKSLVWAVMAIYHHRNSVIASSQVKLRFDAIADTANGRSDIMTIYRQIILSQSTERVNQKVREELVPKLRKIDPEIRRKMRNIDISDPEEMAANPEWQELLDKSDITDKMMELSKMQAEGSDVFLSTFSHLKTYPFFLCFRICRS